VTVLDVIQRSARFLEEKGVESPRLQIELLLAHALGMPRLQLYLNFDRPLSPAELERMRKDVKRRANREPLQHILGTTSFCGLDLKVGPQALIPRPETELLAEKGWTFLNLTGSKRETRALDFGTGTGCLAIALAVQAPLARIYALDISPEALALARENAGRHQVASRIEFIQSQGVQSLPEDLEFDLIISNPPYIPTAEIETLDPEVRDHDPRVALDGGPDGLDCYRYLARNTSGLLRAGGKMMLEFGDGQAAPLRELFEAETWTVESVEPDLSARPRILILSRAKQIHISEK
jgi:release factor glutamine methyltransferase